MAESVKPRFAVDLDEIERQLAYAQSGPAPGQNPGRSDPLAELARIVGQDDPFQSILSAERAPRAASREAAEFEDLFASRDQGGRHHSHPDPRRSFDRQAPTDLDDYADRERQYEPYEHHQAPQPGYAEHSPEHDGYADSAEFEDHVPEREYPARNSRKTLVAVGAVIGAAVLGIAGALMVGGSPAMLSGGEPPLIKATAEPTKVAPQTPGGVEFPNQNKQIYERAGQEAAPTKVVNREEQPVDVRQATRTASADATGATAGSPTASSGLALGEPRKVRTISIRPDGTVILPDSKPAAAPTVTTATPAPTIAPVRPSPPAAATPAQAESPNVRLASATPPATVPRAAAATPATSGGSSPQAAGTPAAQPAPQRVASVQPTALPAAAPATEPGLTGGFAVQLGVSTSEGDAKSALQRFQQKFTDLDGKPPLIRKAEVNGNTLYRVRVGPMSREEASSLCSKIQGQGGQCFVAKN